MACSSIDFAWATSGGQLVWAELTDADSDAMNTTLVTVAKTFFMSSVLSNLVNCHQPAYTAAASNHWSEAIRRLSGPNLAKETMQMRCHRGLVGESITDQ